MIMKDLGGSDAYSFKRNDVNFCPLTYNGEVTKLTWPLVTDIKKIRDIQIVGIYDLMKRWRFETNRISSVATAQPQSQKPVFDFDLTWWPDLWWPGFEIFTQGVYYNWEQVLKNSGAARCRFSAIHEKPEVWAFFAPPPPLQCACYVWWISVNDCLTRQLLGYFATRDLLGGGGGVKRPHVITRERMAAERRATRRSKVLDDDPPDRRS